MMTIRVTPPVLQDAARDYRIRVVEIGKDAKGSHVRLGIARTSGEDAK